MRILQGGDIFRMDAGALPADAFVELCERAGAAGCQLDLAQAAALDAAALARVRARAEERGLFLELSVPAAALDGAEAFERAAAVARALGVSRLRAGLLSGRRYESFASLAEWRAFADGWRARLTRLAPVVERHRLLLGVENHKDWLAGELADLLAAIGSPNVGCCVDFGNNLSLLEDPMETIVRLAPFAVSTHFKDVAVCATGEGFAMSEVPLGEGILPLREMVDVLRRARPDVDLCLEMITRDPLDVPCRLERYWTARTDRDGAAAARFVEALLAKAWTAPLPRTTGLPAEDAVAVEDEHVRRSMAFARTELGL